MHITETTPFGSRALSDTLPLILMIDDAENDIELLQEALRSCQIAVRFIAAANAIQAFSALRLLSSAVSPALIILDLGLPVQRGDVILSELAVNPSLKDVPTLVLTGSERETDRIQALARGAREYVIKPSTFEGYQALALHIKRYL